MSAFLIEKYDDVFVNIKRCPCCENEVIYLPLDSYYDDMRKKAGATYEVHAETLNKQEYICLKYSCSDRRMIVSFLKRISLWEMGILSYCNLHLKKESISEFWRGVRI